MNIISEIDRSKFNREGFHIVKAMFSEREAKRWRTLVKEALQTNAQNSRLAPVRTKTLADGVTKHSGFWDIVFNPNLLSTIRQLIGEDIRYTQHSDLHIDLPGGRWHRDNAHRVFGHGPDWDENEIPYRVVRVAIYLSDYSSSGSALHLLQGSHRKEGAIQRWEYVFWNKLRSGLRRHGLGNALPHFFFSRPVRSAYTSPGDCIIFDQRLMHAGGRLTGNNSKYSIFLSFGLNNEHSRNHRKFFLRRPTYSAEVPSDLKSRLVEKNLLLDG